MLRYKREGISARNEFLITPSLQSTINSFLSLLLIFNHLSHLFYSSDQIIHNYQFPSHQTNQVILLLHTFKMKASIIAAALFTSFALAAPTTMKAARQSGTQFFKLQLSDDITGHNADVNVPANGEPQSLADLFGNTNLVQDGSVIATSAQNVAPGQNIACIIVDTDSGDEVELDQQVTFAQLTGGDSAEEVDVSDFAIVCEVE